MTNVDTAIRSLFRAKMKFPPLYSSLDEVVLVRASPKFQVKKTPYRMHVIWTLHFRIFKIYVHFSASDRWRFPKDSQHGSSTCSQYEGEQKAKEGNWGWRASRKVNAWVVVFPFRFFFFWGGGWGRLSWWFHYNNKQPMKGEFYSRFLFADWTRQLKLFTLALVLTTTEGNFKAKMARSHFCFWWKHRTKKGKNKRVQMIPVHSWVTFRERTSVDKGVIFIIWPIRPRARFHCKTIEKIPVWGPYAMARAGPEKAVRPC